MMPVTPMVKHLIIINIIFYIGSNFLAKDISYQLFALYFPLTDSFHFWQIFSHMFMHAEFDKMFLHIVTNMFGLYMFGSILEHFWTGNKFLFFYITCGVGAAMLHLGMQYYDIQNVMNSYNLNLSFEQLRALGSIETYNAMPYEEIYKILLQKNIFSTEFCNENLNGLVKVIESMQGSAVGASGALYGVLVAFAVMFPDKELMLLFLPFPIKARYFVPLLVAYDLYAGISGTSLFGGGGIAHFAHIGGAITGLLIMFLWRKNKFNFKRLN